MTDFGKIGAYTAAHYGKSLFWYMSEILLGFYLAEVYRIAPTDIASLLLIFLLWDAITDPLIGFWLARRSAGTVSLLRAQMLGAVLSAGVFTAVFWRPPDDQGLFGYALVVGLLFRSAYSLYDVPQNVLMRRLAVDSQTRFLMSSLRTAFSAVATLSVSLAITWILSGESQSAISTGYLSVAVLFALIAILSAALLCFVATSLPQERQAPPAPQALHIVTTIRVPAIRNAFLAVFCASIGWPLFSKLLPFHAAYVLQGDRMVGAMVAAIAISSAVSQPLWMAMNRRIRKERLLLFALSAIWIAGGTFLLFAHRGALSALLATAALAAVSSLVSALLWAYFADQLSQLQGEVSDVFAFGLFTFMSKFGLGVSGFALGWVLEWSDYAPDTSLGEAGQERLALAMALAPALCASIAILSIYRASARTALPRSPVSVAGSRHAAD